MLHIILVDMLRLNKKELEKLIQAAKDRLEILEKAEKITKN